MNKQRTFNRLLRLGLILFGGGGHENGDLDDTSVDENPDNPDEDYSENEDSIDIDSGLESMNLEQSLTDDTVEEVTISGQSKLDMLQNGMSTESSIATESRDSLHKRLTEQTNKPKQVSFLGGPEDHEGKPCHESNCNCHFCYAEHWGGVYCNNCHHAVTSHY